MNKLNLKTHQEVLEYVVREVIKQGRPGVTLSTGRCSFRVRSPIHGTLKCAAGHLLTTAECYSSGGRSWKGFVAEGRRPARLAEFDDLIQGLQAIHDAESAAPPPFFLERFIRHATSLAGRMQLVMPDISDIYKPRQP